MSSEIRMLPRSYAENYAMPTHCRTSSTFRVEQDQNSFTLCILPSPPRLPIGNSSLFSEMNKESSWNSRKIKFRKKSKTFFLTSIRVQLRLVFDSENSDSEARPSVIIILYCTVLPPESSPSSNLPSTVLY